VHCCRLVPCSLEMHTVRDAFIVIYSKYCTCMLYLGKVIFESGVVPEMIHFLTSKDMSSLYFRFDIYSAYSRLELRKLPWCTPKE
jgi:hypothetical protein